MFVIKRMDQGGGYLALPGRKSCFTRNLQSARTISGIALSLAVSLPFILAGIVLWTVWRYEPPTREPVRSEGYLSIPRPRCDHLSGRDWQGCMGVGPRTGIAPHKGKRK